MFENIAALDIGSSSIKLITAKTGVRNFQIKTFSYQELDNSIEDRNTAISEALTAILAEEDLKGHTLLCNLPMEKTIIRNITFPFNDVGKIADAIPYEVDENIPFNRDDLSMDFQALRSDNVEEGKILLAATLKSNVLEVSSLLSEHNLIPAKMGLETNSLLESYRFFYKNEQELVILLDLGNNKSIINIVKNGSLQYTRAIPQAMEEIGKAVSHALKLSKAETLNILKNLSLDLNDFDTNITKEKYKSLKIKKADLRIIYDIHRQFIKTLAEQVAITVKAYDSQISLDDFSKLLISGGGANISGVGEVISEELDIAVSQLPISENMKGYEFSSQLQLAFGLLLSYINEKRGYINFLKGEFIPDIERKSYKIYYVAAFFGVLTLLAIITNVVVSLIISSITNAKYDEIIRGRYTQYFKSAPTTNDPLEEAIQLLNAEKRKFDIISVLAPPDELCMSILQTITSSLKNDGSFNMKNFIYNERIIKIEGTVASHTIIDEMKSTLEKNPILESIKAEIKTARNETTFSMTIQLKKRDDKKEKPK